MQIKQSTIRTTATITTTTTTTAMTTFGGKLGIEGGEVVELEIGVGVVAEEVVRAGRTEGVGLEKNSDDSSL